MKKIEMVRVRSTPDAVLETIPALKELIENLRGELTEGDIQIMQHTQYQGDISVFIVWNNDRVPEKSRGGVLVAEMLQEIGALNHFVWLSK